MSVFRIGQSVKLNGHHAESGLSKGTVLTVSNIVPNGIVSCWWEDKSIIVFSNPMYWISPVVEDPLLPEEEDDCDAGEETPCERLGYKIGDAFVVTEDTENLKKGSILYLVEMDAPDFPFFSFSNKLEDSFYVSFDILKKREVESEAERRGAKFGVNGVIKATGEKVVFQKESVSSPGVLFWRVFNDNNCSVFSYEPHQIRLDHEPEYKEIPFSEATHEQRMTAGAVFDPVTNRSVIEVLRFLDGTYVCQVSGSTALLRNVSRLRVRVPA